MRTKKTSKGKNRRAFVFASGQVATEQKTREVVGVMEHPMVPSRREKTIPIAGISIVDLLSMTNAIEARIKGGPVVVEEMSVKAQMQLGRMLRSCGSDKRKLMRQRDRLNLVIMRKNLIEHKPTEENRKRYLKILDEYDLK